MIDRASCAAFAALVFIQSTRGAALAQSAQSPPQTPPQVVVTVDVIGATPLPGVEIPLDKMPSPVQTAISRDIDESGAADLSDFMNRRLNGVFINEVQGNPFQPDVNYRGYTASPLLGTPQGLSVYMDGVRLNQPFGDVVSWDLIPRIAIGTTTLIPGSNPLFGLNTLGGAVAIQTKDGRADAGTSVQLSYGSALRRAVEFQHGGSRADGLNWYVAGNVFAEDGWRDRSPSDVAQLFGKVGWSRERFDLSVMSAFADNALTGNGLQDFRLIDRSYTSVYTSPDQTDNRSALLSGSWRFRPSVRWSWAANAYFRDLRTRTFNGDINEDSLDQSVYQPGAAERAALTAAGYTGVPASGATAANTPFPFWRCIGNALIRDEPGEKCNGLLNRTSTSQRNGGASLQTTRVGSVGRSSHQLTVGGALDRSGVTFTQSSELGYLNSDRTVTGVGAFGDGVTGGNVDGVPYDTRVDLDGTIQTVSAYATDTITAGVWNVTLSGRFNRTGIDNRDRVRPGGGEGSLDGVHHFQRFNPAAGLTRALPRGLNLYASYSEGNRAPTSIELGCADPSQPCKLPNAMAGDPPLQQVVARTFEAGIRRLSASRPHLGWNAGVFAARNSRDILFVSSEQTGFGYFKNFGRTDREGLELGVNGQVGRLRFGGGYTFLSATYGSEETVDGTANSTNDAARSGAKGLDGTIVIEPGDRIPAIPRHTLKLFADVEVTRAVSVDVDVVAASGTYARGNENNQHQPDGVYYLGRGTTSGYALVNVGGRYRVNGWLHLLAQLNNVLDQRYETFGQLGPAGATADGAFIARALPAVNGAFPVPQTTFFTPGAPRQAWIAARLRF